MVKSMTGFGKAQVELDGRLVTIEVKCINSKQLDLNLKLPAAYRDREPEIRAVAQQKLERGKIDISVSVEYAGAEANFVLNKPVVISYYRQLKDLVRELPEEEAGGLLQAALRMPDVLKSDKDEPGEEEWAIFLASYSGAVEKADEFRAREGAALALDFQARISRILQLLGEVSPYEEGRISSLRRKITGQINDLMGNVEFDKNRLEQEMIYYLEKLDITEEKVRLRKHCDYFLETLSDEDSNGKKLGFIAQEIGREVNTLGSKANEVNIQKLVILMKDELEKVKEQLNNIL